MFNFFLFELIGGLIIIIFKGFKIPYNQARKHPYAAIIGFVSVLALILFFINIW